jgi:predicted NUDIX family NTP pyrophosphohydrolase
MPQRSAGLLLYRRNGSGIEVLLVHPGGPFWVNKDAGAWSIPKGTYDPETEDGFAAAKREFAEETGTAASAAMKCEPMALGSFRQSSAKTVDVWAAEGEFDPTNLVSNTFQMEWPLRSGRMIEASEVDRAEWFAAEVAADKILKGQRQVLEALLRHLDGGQP